MKEGEEAAKDRVGRNDRLGQGSGEGKPQGNKERGDNKKEPRTEWAGMTDWVEAIHGGAEIGTENSYFESLWQDPYHLPEWTQLSLLSAPCGLSCPLGFCPFDPSGPFDLFGLFLPLPATSAWERPLALVLPCIRAFAFTGWERRSLIRVCPYRRPGRSAKAVRG